jgi:hypothetical protein
MTKEPDVPHPVSVRLIFQPDSPAPGAGPDTCTPQPALEIVLLHTGTPQSTDRMIERLWGHTSTPAPVDTKAADPLNHRGITIPCDLVRCRRLKNPAPTNSTPPLPTAPANRTTPAPASVPKLPYRSDSRTHPPLTQ